MRNLNFLKLFYGLMLVMVSTAFVSCVDDNDDTEAPYLEVSPTTLIFGLDGQPASGSQASFDISTNRSWKATVKDDKSWVTLSKYEGEGSATIQVSIPENINGNASIVIEVSNKVGVLMSETVTIQSGETIAPTEIYKETVGSGSADGNPAISAYTGWDNKEVTYSGTNATVRASQSNAGGYDGASGPNNVFFASAPAEFIINKIPLTEQQTKLQLTFGSIYVKDYDNKDYTFDMSKFEVYLSGDGTTWVPLTYTKDNGDAEKPNWIFATANFTLKQAITSLYIKFKALDSSKYRVDDITLSTGNGGTIIDLEGGEEPEPGEAKVITIPELNAMMTTTQTPVDATADRYFEAVVQNDVEGGNYSFNNLILATENATTAGNGITLFGNQVEPTAIDVKKGDKVKVTLYKGLAKTVNYNGMFEVTGGKDDTWAKIEKLGTATITPIIITADKLADYQGMTVTIQNATTATAGVWANTNSISSHTFTASGTEFIVFCKKDATAFIDQPYSVATGAISGLAAVNSNKGQLVPRNLEDVKNFQSSTPTILSADPASWSFPSTGGTKDIEISVANMGSNTLSYSGLSGILSASIDGTKVTVTAEANSTASEIKQTLKVTLTNGNSIDIPIIVEAPSSGNETVISVDFTIADNYPSTFPKLSANKQVDAQTFSFGGYDFVFAGSTGDGYYQAMDKGTPYVLTGKQGAYIELPAITGKKLTKVTATTRNGASKKVTVSIVDTNNNEVTGGAAILWAQENEQLEYVYNLSGTSTNTKYRIYIANGNNAQFVNLELIYE